MEVTRLVASRSQAFRQGDAPERREAALLSVAASRLHRSVDADIRLSATKTPLMVDAGDPRQEQAQAMAGGAGSVCRTPASATHAAAGSVL